MTTRPPPTYRHRVIVCGSRNATDPAPVVLVLNAYHALTPITLLATGAATGIDTFALDWAKDNAVPFMGIPADWYPKHDGVLDRSAGPKRNTKLVAWARPHTCIAFEGGAGTRDCIEKCRKAGARIVDVKK